MPERREAAIAVLLLVDDDDDVARAFTRALERRGLEVHRARTGNEALAMIGVMPRLDAAVVDLVLPGAGGLEVVRRLREAHPACRIVATTGLASDAIDQAFRAAGADRFLTKPVELADLLAAVSSA